MTHENQIREAAYFLWQHAGCPTNRDREFYLEAEYHLERCNLAINTLLAHWTAALDIVKYYSFCIRPVKGGYVAYSLEMPHVHGAVCCGYEMALDRALSVTKRAIFELIKAGKPPPLAQKTATEAEQ